jgi:hypothetical protein
LSKTIVTIKEGELFAEKEKARNPNTVRELDVVLDP